MNEVNVKVKLMHPDAKIPFYGSEQAAGFDIYATQDVILEPGKLTKIPSGLAVEIPEGFCLQLWDRSGLGIKGIHHFTGIIDSDYRGEFNLLLFNSGEKEYKIEKGDRIVQALILPVWKGKFEKVDNLSETKRGTKGFHSTGKK